MVKVLAMWTKLCFVKNTGICNFIERILNGLPTQFSGDSL